MVKIKIEFTNDEINNILYLYCDEMKSMRKIADYYHVNVSVIKRILKEHDITIRDNNLYKSKNINENYFKEIDSEDKAYFLGLIYADGCVTRNNKTFSIKLNESDEDIIYKMRECFESEHSIVHAVNTNGFSNYTKYSMLSINNENFVSHLIDKGVVMNKSKVLKFPYNKIPEELIRHFIRGYFDGDGSVYYTYHEDVICISFVGTEDMLNGILKYLKKVCGTDAHLHKYKNKEIYDLKIGGNNQVKKIFNYLYDDTSYYLNRKYLKFVNFFNKDLVA